MVTPAVAMPRSRQVDNALASLWPISIGLETLLLLVNNDDWLDPNRMSNGVIGRIEARIAERAHGVHATVKSSQAPRH
jgi:hypothetical protein